MEDLKYLTNKNSVYQITSAMQKIAKAIRTEKAQNIKDTNIKEIDFLKEQCLNENVQLSLLSYQTFVRLVEDGTLDAPFVLSMFVSMLPSASVCQYTALSEGVISLLLLDLKRRSILMKSNDTYVCPFGLKPPQHPLIMLFQKKDANINDLANKINGICSHHDKDIRGNSIEFLRPVFLFILCNPNIVPDSKTMWTSLLSHSKKSLSAQALVYDILFWSNTSTAASCLYTSILLTEVIDFMVNQQKYSNAIELTVYLACLLGDLVRWGYDPRPGLAVIMNVLYRATDTAKPSLNVLLVLLAQTLHSISPVYMSDLTRLLRLIVITMEGGNAITLNMLVDGLIIWLANPSFIGADGLSDAQAIVQHITSDQYQTSGKITLPSKVKYFHPDFAVAYDLAVLSEHLTDDNCDGRVEDFVESLNQPAQLEFCDKINLFIRALFLWNSTASEKVYVSLIEILCRIVRRNETVAIDLMLPWLYKLSNIQGAAVQLELLRGLTNFAVVKENIPIILNTLKSISCGSLKPFAIDLYLRLWKCESRTYSFLHTLLSVPYENESAAWELNVAKAHTIKEICELKPAQHGTDLVVHLSNILNNCSSARGEAATAIALEAIIVLCYSHTVNIASTWKALSVRFQNETRIRPLISLCNFFGKVPLLRSPTPEYEQLHSDAMSKLWKYVVLSDNGLIISAALTALQNFDYTEVPLIQIPDVYRQSLIIPSEFTKLATEADREPYEVVPYIPGECWLQVIQYANHSAINAAASLVAHLIHREIDAYRSGVYALPEGHPEPSSLSRLNKQSPLRAVVRFLLAQSNGDGIAATEIVIVACLRAVSTKFPKPMPPLNWFFLLEFMGRSLDMKCLCLQIAANQITQSGSAKNVLENYLTAFKAAECLDPEEIDYCLALLPDLVTDITTAVFKPFVEHIFAYALAQAELKGFSKGCLLESALHSAEAVFQKHSTNLDNVTVVTDVFKRFLKLIDLDSEIFTVFTRACASLPANVVETMTIPTTNSSAAQFQKFTIIRCFLAKKGARKSLENPLIWLNIIVDSTVYSKADHSFVLEHLAAILHQHESHRSVCNWVMEILGKIQAALSNKTKENEAYYLFLIDVFVLSVVVVSGLANTFSIANTVATSRPKRLDIFGEALHVLCQRDFWSENVIRIYEFLYHIYVNADLPDDIIEATKNALLCSKGQSYFQEKGVWMKFVGLRQLSKPSACI